MNAQLAGPFEQAAAIPYRGQGGQAEFCLITSTTTGRWGFPKGMIEPGDTPEQTALKEAAEEAGLHGVLVGEALGAFAYEKSGRRLRVLVFLMEVKRVESHWPEANRRARQWCAPAAVRLLLGHPEQQRLFDAALKRLGAL